MSCKERGDRCQGIFGQDLLSFAQVSDRVLENTVEIDHKVPSFQEGDSTRVGRVQGDTVFRDVFVVKDFGGILDCRLKLPLSDDTTPRDGDIHVQLIHGPELILAVLATDHTRLQVCAVLVFPAPSGSEATSPHCETRPSRPRSCMLQGATRALAPVRTEWQLSP